MWQYFNGTENANQHRMKKKEQEQERVQKKEEKKDSHCMRFMAAFVLF